MLAASIDGFLLFWQPAASYNTNIVLFLFNIVIVRGK